jgi:hypothetical protein
MTAGRRPQAGLQSIAVRGRWLISTALAALVCLTSVAVHTQQPPRSTPPTFTWPHAFDLSNDAASWNATNVDADGVRLHVEYPEGWSLRRDPSAREIARVANAAGTAALVIVKPAATTGPFAGPLSKAQLTAYAERAKRGAQARSPNVQLDAFGQAPAAAGSWVWTQWSAMETDFKGRPQRLRSWDFQTAVAGKEIRVLLLVTLQNVTDEERQARTDALAAEFGAMLRHLTISSR